MDNMIAPIVFRIKRRTPRARKLSWLATMLFAIGVFVVISIFFCGFTIPSTADWILYLLIPAIAFFVFGIVFWTKSNNAQNATLAFYNDKIVYKGIGETIEMFPGQVSHAQQSGKVVKIVFSGKTLTIVSEQADDVTNNVNSFVSAYTNAAVAAAVQVPVATAPAQASAPTPSLSPEDIRKYKQLVDDGVITQEQFDEILKKSI